MMMFGRFSQDNSTKILSLDYFMQSAISTGKIDKLRISLILISSVLLGIWATMHTIALRNILLWFGGLLAIFYWIKWLNASNNEPLELRPSLAAWIPLGLIALMFLWVVIHFVYFSVDQQRQLEELISTWIRAFLATLIGSASGLALIRSRASTTLLWLGLIFSFVVLIFQYIPKAIQRNSIFGVDFFSNYIYWAKFNGVLAGTILIAGLLGLLIDYFLANVAQMEVEGAVGPKNLKTNFFIPVYASLGIFLATYSFVFIFDTKAGVALVVILIGFWVLFGSVSLAVKILKFRKQKNYINAYKKLAGIFLIFVTLVGFLAFKHVKNNPGWETLFSDIAIAVQIDKYPNWQNPSKYGIPLRKDGTTVASNTYERVSWATVGLKLIAMQPLGNGVFRSFSEQVKSLVPGFDSAAYTHSAWVDLGLAFGLPGILLLPVALIVMFGRAAAGLSGCYKATIITFTLATLVLYAVGEYAFQHGIEILFYVCGLLGGLSLLTPVKQKQVEPQDCGHH